MDLDRLKIAIEFLKDGLGFSVGGLRLEITEQSFIITGYSRVYYFENLTREIVLEELKESKAIFQEMLDASQDLKNLTINKKIEYVLDYDDSGKCGIALCEERDGQIKWIADLK